MEIIWINLNLTGMMVSKGLVGVNIPKVLYFRISRMYGSKLSIPTNGWFHRLSPFTGYRTTKISIYPVVI
jgi:hypothetical protein